MEETVPFDVQWAAFQVRRSRILEKIYDFNTRLNNLSEEPDLKPQLKEKGDLRKKLPMLRNLIEVDAHAESRRIWWLQVRRKALSSPTDRKSLDKLLKTRNDRLEELLKIDAPETIIRKERELIQDIELPIEELALVYQDRRKHAESKRQESEQNLQDALARIAEIDKIYREARRCMKHALDEAEAEKVALHAEEVEWGTSSPAHLEWMLCSQPTYRDYLMRRYRKRFPAEPHTPLPIERVVQCAPVRIREREIVLEPAPQAPEGAPAPWKFFVTFVPAVAGTELPLNEKQFVEVLVAEMCRATYKGLKPEFVRMRLVKLINLSAHERRTLKRVIGDCDVKGWKIWRAGQEHRLLLQIDEVKRVIRFLPRLRRDAYDD